MAKRYDPILCMLVDEPTKAQDELSLAQKKQVVTELKGYLKKSYNFSDESEDARAYEDLRYMFTTGSRKSISGLFENAVKKTGAHDSVEMKDAEFQMFGPEFHHPIIKANSKEEAIKKAKEIYGWGGKVEAVKVSDKNTLDKAIKVCDASTGHKVVVFVENYLRSIGKNNSTGKYDKIVQGVKSLLSQSLLDDEGLKKAAEHEADRLLKKYNL